MAKTNVVIHFTHYTGELSIPKVHNYILPIYLKVLRSADFDGQHR